LKYCSRFNIPAFYRTPLLYLITRQIISTAGSLVVRVCRVPILYCSCLQTGSSHCRFRSGLVLLLRAGTGISTLLPALYTPLRGFVPAIFFFYLFCTISTTFGCSLWFQAGQVRLRLDHCGSSATYLRVVIYFPAVCTAAFAFDLPVAVPSRLRRFPALRYFQHHACRSMHWFFRCPRFTGSFCHHCSCLAVPPAIHLLLLTFRRRCHLRTPALGCAVP